MSDEEKIIAIAAAENISVKECQRRLAELQRRTQVSVAVAVEFLYDFAVKNPLERNPNT